MCVSGERAAVAEPGKKTDLQPAEDAARPTGETQDVQGEADARTRPFDAVFTQTHTHTLTCTYSCCQLLILDTQPSSEAAVALEPHLAAGLEPPTAAQVHLHFNAPAPHKSFGEALERSAGSRWVIAQTWWRWRAAAK